MLHSGIIQVITFTSINLLLQRRLKGAYRFSRINFLTTMQGMAPTPAWNVSGCDTFVLVKSLEMLTQANDVEIA